MVDDGAEIDNDNAPDTDVAEAVAYITHAHEVRTAYPTTPQYRSDPPRGQAPVPEPRPSDPTGATPSPLIEGEGFLWRLSAIAGGRGGRPFLTDDINTAVSHALMGAEDMSSTDPNAAEREVRDILLNARDERERLNRHGAVGSDKTSRATTGRTSRVERDEVRAVAAKLDSDPRICFAIIRWMAGPEYHSSDAATDPSYWYIPLCVEHNLDPVTGARLPKWTGKAACIQRLHDAGATWADPRDVYTAFGVYKARKATGTRLLLEAKEETLRIDGLRRQLWVIVDDPDPDMRALAQPDAGDIIRAIQDRWPRDLGL